MHDLPHKEISMLRFAMVLTLFVMASESAWAATTLDEAINKCEGLVNGKLGVKWDVVKKNGYKFDDEAIEPDVLLSVGKSAASVVEVLRTKKKLYDSEDESFKILKVFAFMERKVIALNFHLYDATGKGDWRVIDCFQVGINIKDKDK